MRRFVFAAFSMAFLFCCSTVRAQVDPMLEQGTKPFGAYSSDFDSISMVNGGLTVHIPLFSYPQRGNKLRLNLRLDYESSGWQVAGTSHNPPIIITMSNMLFSGFKISEDQHLMEANGCEGYTPGWPAIFSADGSAHQLGQTSLSQGIQGFESIDATGIRLSGFEFNSTGNKLAATGTITDPEGTIYTPGVPTTYNGGLQYGDYKSWAVGLPVNYSKEDANGNSISFTTTSGWTDTVGRQIPSPPFVGKSGATDSTGCLGPLAIYSAYVWSIPGPSGGTTQLKVCFVYIQVGTDFFPNNTEYAEVGTGAYTIQSVLVYNGSSWTTSPAWVFEYSDQPPSGPNYGNLTQITFPTGGTVSYAWVNFNLGTGTYGRAVSSKTVNANDGSGAHTWTYSYSRNTGGVTTTVTDPLGNDTVHTITVLGYNAFYPQEVDYYQGSHSGGTLLKSVKTDYRSLPLKTPCSGSQTGAVDIAPIRVTTIWSNGQQTKTETDYDSNLTFTIGTSTQYTAGYGNPTNKREYDYGSGAPGALLRTTTTNYLAFSNSTYLTNNLLSPPSSVQVLNGAGSTASYTTYAYDETGGLVASGITTQHVASPYGNARGNQTSIHRELLNGVAVQTTNCPVSVSSGGYLVSNIVYFDTGTINVSNDPCTHPTTYVYSSTYAGAYPTKVTNVLNQSTNHAYDFDTGLLTSTTDPNSQPTTYTYDAMWRLATASYPDGGLDTVTHQETSFPFTATSTKKMASSQNYVTTSVFDGLGRLSQSQLSSDPSGTDYTIITYDANGRKASQTNPYRTTSDPTYGATNYQYDALNRANLVTMPDGSRITTNYAGNTTTVTDEAGKNRESFMDGLGRMTEVIENPGGLGYATTYQLDVLNNLASVLQNGSRQRTFAYDSLSRLTSSTNPESGTLSFAYDADSNLITRIAPAPNQTGASTVTTTYSYDALNRITQRSYSDGTTPTAFFTYDGTGTWGVTQTNTVGRLMEAWAGTSCCASTGAEIFSYDPMGRILLNTQYSAATGQYSPLNYTYDLAGDILSATNGEGVTISYQYNSAQQATVVTSSLVDATHPATLASGIKYAPNGSTSQMTYGNGLTESSVYNPRFQPCRDNVNSSGTVFTSLAACGSTSMPSGNLLDLQYSWNAGSADNGNLVGAVVGGVQTYSRSYIYDQLNRLSSMSGTGGLCTGLNWSYDAWGNRTSQTQVSGTCFQQSTTTITTKNQFSGYGYDAAGNMTSQPGATYSYDAENRLTLSSGDAASYLYDASGRRVTKTLSGAYRNYLYDTQGNVVSEVTSAGWAVGNVYLNGRMTAEYANGTTYFLTGDHLGSSRLLTTLAKGVQDCNGFYPYGEQDPGICTSSNTTTHKFTGKERDSESGLDNSQARYYTSALGRFMSPDEPLVDQQSENPQSWNLYGYVRNNPLSNTDPSGNACVSDGNGGWNDNNSGGESCADANAENQNGGQKVYVNAPDPDDQLGPYAIAVARGTQMAEPGVRLAFNGLALFGNLVAPGSMIAAQCISDPGSCSKGNIALAVLPIIIPEARLTKVLHAHTAGGLLSAGKSLFSAGEDVRALIQAAESAKTTVQAGGNIERIVDAGRVIGFDRSTGQITSIYTVITDRSGNLITAFPGRP